MHAFLICLFFVCAPSTAAFFYTFSFFTPLAAPWFLITAYRHNPQYTKTDRVTTSTLWRRDGTDGAENLHVSLARPLVRPTRMARKKK